MSASHSATEERSVTRWGSWFGSALLALAVTVALGACGSSSKSNSSSASSGGKTGGKSVTLVEGTAPQSIDPSLDFTTQGSESIWLRYLSLYTYAHASGKAGQKVIPAVATAMPTISDGGKTYTITIRKGLKYSDGTPLKASDWKFSVERAIKLGWSASSFITSASNVIGATAYSKGKASSISGITPDDATGTIKIRLAAPYGAFLNVLALPSIGFIPSTTPMKDQSSNPPPGFGPYVAKNVVPNVSYDVDINPNYAAQAIPGVPPGHVNVHVKIESNTTTEASDVLNNNADVFDWGDTVPPALVSQVASQASDRFKKEQTALSFYFFLNTQEKPFNNQLAREAVIMALDRNALSKLDSGNITPGCYLIPPGIAGHPTAPCPYGDPAAPPNIAKAKQLVQQSGQAGAPVTVWGQQRQPRLEYTTNLVATLNSIGFKATLKPIADHQYFSTIETLKNHPQTGFADWQQDFPNPTDFYQNLVDANAIAPVGNSNYEEANDPYIQAQLKKLYAIPAAQLTSAAAKWQALDEYLAKKAYTAVYGYELVPNFTSNRINFSSIVFHPLYGTDWSSLQLK
jgi:peptide/nickel transport system substrate-binding protein